MTALLDRFDSVRRNGDGRWIARCPAHQDKRPSLSIRETADGQTLLHCFAGCEVDNVLAPVGATWPDLYPPSDRTLPGRPLRREFVASATESLRCLASEAIVRAARRRR